MGPRVFLSYGHDEYALFAERLKSDLEAHDHEVWFDLNRLRAGGQWEAYIEEGLEWASALPSSGCFLLLMTPHSVRRPDGFCLNELARALQRGLTVIPVMVATSEPPLSISRLQWLDMRDCQPPDENTGPYSRKLAQLLDAIDHQRLDFEGVQVRLSQRLAPIDFEADIRPHLDDFVGREWVIRAYTAWLARRDGPRVFWMVGMPGVGKSAIAAKLIVTRPEILAVHVCRYGNAERADPRRAVQSIAFQLASQLPDYRERLNALDLDRLGAERDPRTLFESVITQPLSAGFPVPEQPIVVLVDALDEAGDAHGNAFAKLVAAEFHRAPEWLRLFVTSRDVNEVKYPLQALTPYVLDASTADNWNDLRDYLFHKLGKTAGGADIDARTVDVILRKSEGLFLYAVWVCKEVAENRLSLERPEDFPQGLGGIYAQFFEREFPDLDRYRERYRAVLEVVVAAREPLRTQDLAHIFSWSDYDQRENLSPLESLFPVRAGRVEPFHLSILDWLRDERKAGPYWVSGKQGNERLAKFGWEEYRGGGVDRMSPYTLVHLPAHLAASASHNTNLVTLLMDFDWLQAKLEASDIVALYRDCSYTEDQAVQLLRETLRRGALALQKDRALLAGQVLGRLGHSESPEIRRLTARAAEWRGAPWLRPLSASLLRPGDPLKVALWGHAGTVRSMAVTADGRRAATAGNSSPDQTLRIWDLELGTEVACLPGQAPAGGWTPLALTPDGTKVLCGAQDHINVWDVRSREVLSSFDTQGRVTALAISGQGRYVISGSSEGTVVVWDLDTQRIVGDPLFHGDEVDAVAITHDGRLGVSASETAIRMWDLTRGAQMRETRADLGTWSTHWSRLLAIRGDHRCVLTGSPPRLWNLDTEELGPLADMPVSSTVLAVDALFDTALISGEGTFQVWSLARGAATADIPTFGGWLVSVAAMTPDARWALDASFNHEVRVWDLSRLSLRDAREAPRGEPKNIRITEDSSWAMVEYGAGKPRAWKISTGSLLPEPPPDASWMEEPAVRETSSKKKAKKGGPDTPRSAVGDRFETWFKEETWTLHLVEDEEGKVADFVCDSPIRVVAIAPDHTIVVAEASGSVHFLRLEGA